MTKSVTGSKIEYGESQMSASINKMIEHLNMILHCEESWDGSFYKFEAMGNSIVLFRIRLDGGDVKTKIKSFELTDDSDRLINETSDIIDWELQMD